MPGPVGKATTLSNTPSNNTRFKCFAHEVFVLFFTFLIYSMHFGGGEMGWYLCHCASDSTDLWILAANKCLHKFQKLHFRHQKEAPNTVINILLANLKQCTHIISCEFDGITRCCGGRISWEMFREMFSLLNGFCRIGKYLPNACYSVTKDKKDIKKHSANRNYEKLEG